MKKEVQKQAKRSAVVLPSPGVTTRWDSTIREVTSLNRIMGDFNKGLYTLINSIDKEKLTPKDGTAVRMTDFTFTPSDKLILRQFECGSDPCLKLSKFYQLNKATSHETLFVTTAYISMMRETSFLMYDDISHTDLTDLRSCKKIVHVVSSQHSSNEDETGRPEQPMDPCIELFRMLYADDMEERCGLTEGPGVPAMKLPVELSIALLLNPMYGGRGKITSSGLMTAEQYDHAEEDLIGRLQLMREREGGYVEPVVMGEDDSDSMDDPIIHGMSTERERAKDEFRSYLNIVKKNRHAPKSYCEGALTLGNITMGRVKERGVDINASFPFVPCNLADFVCDDGHFDLVAFLKLQSNAYPTLFKLAVCLASIRTN